MRRIQNASAGCGMCGRVVLLILAAVLASAASGRRPVAPGLAEGLSADNGYVTEQESGGAEDPGSYTGSDSAATAENCGTTEKVAPVFVPGYVSLKGEEVASTSYCHTQRIPVREGQEVAAAGPDGQNSEMCFICAFGDDRAEPDKGESGSIYAYTVPEGVDEIVISCETTVTISFIRIVDYSPEKAARLETVQDGYRVSMDVMDEGVSMSMPYFNTKNLNRFEFTASIMAFDRITVRKGKAYFEVNGENLVLSFDGEEVTVAHGLKIADTVSILIRNRDAEATSLVRITSGGREFSYRTPFKYSVGTGKYTVTAPGSFLTDCEAVWTSEALEAPVWLFGDSYVTLHRSKWTWYLVKDGYAERVMINGCPGQTSRDALRALKNLLKLSVPETLVWCLGMNDADPPEAANPDWQAALDEVAGLKDKYGFSLVLCTIPTTPVVDHTQKNAWIRESGYRYVDADAAVRVPGSREWTEGMLSTDGVHPTELGAKALYERFLEDLPELKAGE